MPSPSDIAVVGMACKFPHARDLNELWRVVKEGEVTFEEIPAERWNHASFFDATDVRAADKTYVRKGAFIEGHKEFAALHYGLAPRRVQVMDPQQRLLIEAVRQAMQDAGFESRGFDKPNAGVFFGISANEHRDTLSARMRVQELIDGHYGDKLSPAEAEALKAAVSDVVPMRAFSIAGNLLNMSAAAVSQTFDFGGPSFTIDAACSSALVAIHEAAVNLRAGQCNVAFAGGVYLNLHPDNLVGFSRIGAISPTGICRPFDARADGFVMGEGVGVVVLKRFEDAKRDGDRIYAVIKGSGCNNDGRGEGPMTPRPEGQMEAMSRAHRQTDFPVESIGLVETHGTATTVGDVVEVGALKRFFEERAGHQLGEPYCYLSSIKANVGHTMSAAGVAGFIKATLALYHRTIPPQPSCEELNPKLELEHSPFKIAREATPWNSKGPRRAAVSSFGFGGTNAHVLLEEGAPVNPLLTGEGRERAALRGEVTQPELFLLSAPNANLLAAYAKSVAAEVERTKPAVADVSAALLNRAAFEARLAFTATTREDLLAKLRSAADAILAAPAESRSGPEFAFSPASTTAPKLAFLFPGQGAQRVGLLREVVERIPGLRERLTQLDVAAKTEAGASIVDALYPRAPYDTTAAQAHLTRTEICQPAMAALGIALGEWLRSIGLEPHALLGHSLGEFAAASVAGMLTGEEAVKLVAKRGALMNGLKLADNGTMLAVMSDRATVESAMAGIDGIVVANLNHPTQVVLSGTTQGIEAAQDKMSERGLKSTRLDVSHAFHSPLMKGVDAGLKKALTALELKNPNARVISCISGRIYSDVTEAKDIWVRHATAPVDFVSAVKACDADVFIQVGAGGSLLSFARGGATGTFHSLAATEGGDEAATLFNTLGQLFVRGAPMKTALLAAKNARPVPLPPTPLETQTYWPVERPKQRAPRNTLSSSMQVNTRPVGAAASGAAMDNLVSLFREQMALMQSQAEILRAQAAALQAAVGGDPAALQQLAAAPVAAPMPAPAPVAVAKPPNFSNLVAQKPVPAAAPAPAPVVEAKKDDGEVRKGVEAKVLAHVARISAFPPDTLKLEQTLVGELGFDSLMLVELDQGVAKEWPQLGGLPRELFNKNTSCNHLIDHITNALTKGITAPVTTAAPAKLEAPKLFTPAAVKTELTALREAGPRLTGTVRVTPDSHGLGKALVAAFTERGVKAELATADIPGEFVGAVQLVTGEGDYRNASREALHLAKKLGDSPALFATVTALGGRFGLDGVSDEKLGQAGASAFARSLAQEWPEAQVKSIDVDLAVGAEALAQQLADELLSSNRALEVGLTSAGRVEAQLTAVEQGPRADEFTQLNAASVVLVTGGAKGVGLQLATALARRYHCTVVLGGRSAEGAETAKALADLKVAGAKAAAYFALDSRSASSVQSAAAAIRKAFGTLDAVVHAAGVLADAKVGNKETAQLDAVLETKVEGARALMALPNLKLFVGVGSWAGRFGNAGQTDYSAANAMLAASTRKKIGLRAVTIDFPPWEDSAMAKKIPSFLKQEMLARGVTFLTPAEGTAVFLEALESGSGEVLVARRVPDAGVSQRGSFAVSRLSHVYLNDHQMAGQRVMPLAAALDYVALAADEKAPFTVENFNLERPVMVPDTTWLDVAVRAVAGGQEVTLSQGAALSYRGTVKAGGAPAPQFKQLAPTPALPLSLREFYDGFTFHGPRLQGIQSIEALAEDGVSGWVKGCRPSDWIKDSKRDAWSVDPLIIDSSFQLAGYWAWTKQQRAGFPLGFDRFTQFAPFGSAPVKCTATFGSQDGDVFKGTLVWQDSSGKVLAVMEGARAEFKKRDPQFSAKTNAPAAKAIDPATYDVSKFPEYEELKERMQLAEAFNLKNPYFSVQEGICGDTTVVGGKKMKNFSSYNYVGNSGDPKVSKAAKDAIEKYGTSVSASRVASGERPLTRQLELGLARFFGTEDAIVLVSGHATNVTVIGHVVGPGDLILHDALAHDSIIGGAKLSGAKRRPFPHNDFEALERALESLRPHYRRVLICIEGTYSMDGDIPDLPKFIEVKKKYGAMLLVDEAHSAGVIGKNGRGIGEYFDVNRADVDMWMGTLSKSFASCGGYICGSKELVEYLKYTTPGFVYSVGISPPNAAAALASLENLEAEPWRPQKAQANAKLFVKLLRERGVDTGMATGESAVVPAIVGNSVLCLQLSDRLKERGINVQPILYPAVEEHLARLRFFLSSLHNEQQLKETADTVAEELHQLRKQMEADAVA
ncbi:MAG: aminotransferase class I/II-fold pyridoxal phosphate-dependent enzyme [Myxococcaceae bacterium]